MSSIDTKTALEQGVAIYDKWKKFPEDLAKFKLVIANIQQYYSDQQQNEESSSSSATSGQNFDLVLIDEAHHALAPSWKKTIKLFQQNNSRIIFFTATPHPRGRNKNYDLLLLFIFFNLLWIDLVDVFFLMFVCLFVFLRWTNCYLSFKYCLSSFV